MRIAIVCYPTIGGSGVLATELGKNLINRGHNVYFVSYKVPFRLRRISSKFHKVDVLTHPLFKFPPYSLALASKIFDVVKKYKLHIVHSHYAIPHSTSALLAKQMTKDKIKIITTLHGTDVELLGPTSAYKSILNYSLEKSDGLTAVSNFLAKLAKKDLGIKKHIKVIYNFVDTKKYTPSKKEKKERIIIHCSNFRPIKRVQDVVKTFDLIQKEISCKLYLVGDGPEKPKIERLVVKRGLQKKVVFFGNVLNIAAILKKASLFILPSEIESFGLAALEAMSCGVPVIATKVGGIPELVENKRTGYLTKVGDVHSMANFASELLLDENLYEKMSTASRKRAVQNFSIEKIVPEYEKFYKEIT